MAFRIILAWLLALSSLLAQPYHGYDVLALAKYCDTYLEAPRLPAVSTLLVTFGSPINCLRKALGRGDLKLVQVDLIDATCWRRRECAKGAARPDDLFKIEGRARAIQYLADEFPEVQFQASPALEHDVHESATVRAMLDAAKRGCPSCQIIQSPNSGVIIPGVPVERHGTQSSGYSVSGDGSNMFDGDNLDGDGNDFNHSRAGQFSTYAWTNSFNLRCTGEKTFTLPAKRTFRPNIDEFKQAWYIFQPQQPIPTPPKQCKVVSRVSNGEIVKTNAEQYCNSKYVKPDNRAGRGLFILRNTRTRLRKLRILRPGSGIQVSSAIYYGGYAGGMSRYYIGLGSRNPPRPTALYQALVGEWGYLDLGSGNCLLFNAIRRMGVYR